VGNLFPNVLSVWSDLNIKSPYEYMPYSEEKVWWKCHNQKHEDYYRDIKESNYSEFRCPKCMDELKNSTLQTKVVNYLLTKYNYTINHERKCSIVPRNPHIQGTNNTLPFDNEIVELKLIIEVHGIQHYESSGWHDLQAKHHNTTPEYELHYQKLKDRYKRLVAKSNGYFYLEIPYWSEKDESYKQLIDFTVSELADKM
jgi:hypothetical protein